ncbi:MAG TPA: DNA-directed RNA polymerase subunit omega [Thermoanaerobaculia bacterium]|nr:DNA-directed RNA polymerase subunit omega [Thermoanaerobaculia bacterium]
MDDRIPSDIDSKFRYVLLTAGRAEQLMRGARPKIDVPETKPTTVAMMEIDRSAVEWGYGPSPEEQEAAAAAEAAAAEAAAQAAAGEGEEVH